MKKIITSLLIALVMLSCVAVFSACSNDDIPDGLEASDNLLFKAVDGGYELSGVSDKTISEIIIPDTYKNKPVVAIGNKACSGLGNLTQVAIPSTVKTIKKEAFSSCPNLMIIYIGYTFVGNDVDIENSQSSLDLIGSLAFYTSIQLSQIYYNGTMDDFKSVTKYVDAQKSNWNRNTGSPLTILCLDGKLEYHWNKNNGLPYEYPNQPVASEGLEFKLNEDGKSYSVKGIGNCKDTQIVIPDSYNGKPVTGIGTAAFLRNDSITSVIIPNGVTSIGSSAFSICSSLVSVSIPDSVTECLAFSFSGSDKLQFNEYGNSLYLGNDDNPYLVFVSLKNESVTSCTIHSGTKILTEFAIQNCKSVSSFSVLEGNEKFKSIDGSLYSKDGKRLIRYAAASNRTSFTVSGTVTVIEYGALSYSKSLENVIVSGGVKQIEEAAFSHCEKLKSITIPASVEYVGNAFNYNCPLLVDIYYSGTKAQWESIDHTDPETLLGSTTPPYIIHCSDGEIRRFFFD